jgi:hypothetical protein
VASFVVFIEVGNDVYDVLLGVLGLSQRRVHPCDWLGEGLRRVLVALASSFMPFLVVETR